MGMWDGVAESIGVGDYPVNAKPDFDSYGITMICATGGNGPFSQKITSNSSFCPGGTRYARLLHVKNVSFLQFITFL